MNDKFTDVTLKLEIPAKYVKGVGYETYRRCAAHEVLMSFNNDSDKEAFMAWWDERGAALFAPFAETFKPTYKYQMSVVRDEIRASSKG